MRNDDNAHHFDKIDIEMFFGLLREKLDKSQYEVVTAAMAESVDRSIVGRVLDCSEEPRVRIARLRKALRTRASSVRG